jgi:hypothetical protein
MELSVYGPPKTDFLAKRDEKEREFKLALEQLEEFKKRSQESIYPKEIYGIVNPKIMYNAEYIRLLENTVRAKKSLEMIDIILEGLMHERIKILEEFLK